MNILGEILWLFRKEKKVAVLWFLMYVTDLFLPHVKTKLNLVRLIDFINWMTLRYCSLCMFYIVQTCVYMWDVCNAHEGL